MAAGNVLDNPFDFPGRNIKWGQKLTGVIGGNLPNTTFANGSTGTGAVVLQTSPTLTSPLLTSPTLKNGVLVVKTTAGGNLLTFDEEGTGWVCRDNISGLDRWYMYLSSSGENISLFGGINNTSAAILLLDSGYVQALNGGFVAGAPTGGSLGVGKFNAASGYYINGVNLAGNLPATATNNDANTGNVGEYISSAVTVDVSLTSTVGANASSLSLGAGDWDVEGIVIFDISAGSSCTQITAGINTTSATLPVLSNAPLTVDSTLTRTTGKVSLNFPKTRISLASAGTAFAVAQATFSAGTVGCRAFVSARRVR